MSKGEGQDLADGLYIEGYVGSEQVTFTADTGASRTIISCRVYDRMDQESRPILRRSSALRGAGGAPIKERGKAAFRLILGPLEIVREAIVADISDEALLGYDILGDASEGPADILLSRNIIQLGGRDIPCIQKNRVQKSRRVVVADDVSIPGQAEAVVSVYIERLASDDLEAGHFLIEASDTFQDGYPLRLAPTLVDINQGPTCLVRILNPFPNDVKLWQDSEIGTAEKIEKVVSVVTTSENVEEGGNLAQARRIQINQANTTEFEQLKATSVEEVPDHLAQLFERATEGKSEHEKQIIAGLLKKHENTFSRSEWDIGLTDIAEHPINTGDAQPIKQRPRRVPLAFASEEKAAIEDLLRKGVIRQSTSPWSSPIVLVKKKSGAIRPCIDYRRVNALVKPDGFPLPRIQDCLDLLYLVVSI